MFYFCTPQHEILTRVEKLTSLADLKGLKIRATAGVPSEIISALGATPVQVSPPEMYTAIERGTIDGSFVPYPSARSYKIDEIVKSSTYKAALGSVVTGYATNKATWNKLPDDVKAAFDQASRETVERVAKYQDEATVKDKNYLESKGISLLTIEGAGKIELDAAVAAIAANWIKDMDGRGLKGQEVLDAWKAGLAAK